MAALVLTLLGFFLPSQLGLHFWPSWSYVYGLRIDYLSPTLYFTDLLLSVVFLLNFSKIVSLFSSPAKGRILLVGGVFVFFNILFAASPPVALIAWLRMLSLANLVVWLTNQRFNRLTYLLLGLSAGLIITTTLALAQFAGQSSVNGPFYWLGERHFNLSTPGISRLVLPNIYDLRSKILLLRPYATFGHPNALGGFALVSFFVISITYGLKSNFLAKLALPFALLAVALSFSKAAIGAFIFLLLAKLLRLSPRRTLVVSIAVALIISLVSLFSGSAIFGHSLTDRHFLLTDSLAIITHSPLIGVGLGNFITAQGQLGLGLQGSSIYLQPVHNLFFLLLSEVGIIGVSLFCYLIYKLIIDWKLKIDTWTFVLSAVLLTSTLDHYWLTLQQPRLLLAIVLGLILHHDLHQKHLS